MILPKEAAANYELPAAAIRRRGQASLFIGGRERVEGDVRLK